MKTIWSYSRQSVVHILNKGSKMDIMTFRAYKEKMLDNKSKEVIEEASKLIQLTLDLLGTETMSVEGLAIIIAQTEFHSAKIDELISKKAYQGIKT